MSSFGVPCHACIDGKLACIPIFVSGVGGEAVETTEERSEGCR